MIPLSRRALLGLGAALALPRPLLADPAPAASPGGKMATLADAVGRVTVETRIGGRGPFHFLVDTGAVRTVVSSELAARLGLGLGTPAVVRGIVGTVETRLVELHDLAFGPVHLDRIAVPVLPSAGLGADGYLGLDVIDGYYIAFDMPNQQITISEPLPMAFTRARTFETVLPLHGDEGRLMSFDCQVDGISAVAFIDTGADVSVGNSALLGALEHHSANRAELGGITLRDVTDMAAYGNATPVGRVKLGDLSFTNASIVIADVPIFSAWGLADRPALLIGMNFLRQFAMVAIDYRHKLVHLDLGQSAVHGS